MGNVIEIGGKSYRQDKVGEGSWEQHQLYLVTILRKYVAVA